MKPIHLLPLACAAMIAPAFSQAPAAYERPPVLKATEFLPAELLRGTSYRVRDQVATDGYLAHFQIDSDFGTFEAVGVPEVRRRIVEVEAIRKLVETSKGDLFAEGLKRSIETPIDAVKNIVSNPVDSLKEAPKTVGHFFGNIGSAIGRGVDKVKDRTNGEGPPPTAGEVGSSIGNAARSAVGFEKARLETARQLGVDPYSDNKRLQEEMDKVTWAFFAGGLPLRIGAAVASAGVAVAATNMVGVPEDTYLMTQAEITRSDSNYLEEIGVASDDITRFELSQALSTTRRHRITNYLKALPKTKGRGLMIQSANACETAEQAEFLISALAILAERQKSGAADYVSLHVIGRLPGAMTPGGTLEVPAPVDYVTWTETVAGFSRRDDLGTAPKVLVHTGKLSNDAGAGMAAAGWKEVAVEYPTH